MYTNSTNCGELETGDMKGLYRDPSIQAIPTLGPEDCKYELHWAPWGHCGSDSSLHESVLANRRG